MDGGGVLFVTSTLEVGGSERKVVKIANALSREGDDVSLAYLNPPETLLRAVETGVKVHHLRRTGKYSVGALWRLRRLLGERFRAVVSVNFYPLFYIAPAVFSRPSGPAFTACLVNTTEFNANQENLGRIYAPFLRTMDQLVFGCESQMNSWLQRYSLSREKSRYIYNGVETSAYQLDRLQELRSAFRAEFAIPANAVVVGSVGRLAPEKNFDLLLKAVGGIRAEGKAVWLVIVGDGPEKPALEMQVRDAGLNDVVIMPGILDDVRGAVMAMDVFVLPSRAVETFSNAALEAMAMQRPVILSNVGGAREMVEEGVSGLIFEAGDVSGLQSHLRSLIGSEDKRRQFGIAARRRVDERFRFEIMLERYRELLK